MAERVLGLIAGEGRLPVLVARGMRAAGARICAVGLRHHYDPELPPLCDSFVEAGVFQLGRWVRALRQGGATTAVLVGRVAKARMHDPLRLLRQIPDWRSAKLWYRRLRRDRRTAAVLAAVADELAESGITLADSTAYVTDHLAAEGLMTRTPPSPGDEEEIARGWPVLEQLLDLHIGQSIAVCDGRVIAVESLEGTDAMIERAGANAGGMRWALLKGASRTHDRRFDVPVIGIKTIERLARTGAGCTALGAGEVIMIDKPQVIEAADQAGIAVVGVRRGG